MHGREACVAGGCTWQGGMCGRKGVHGGGGMHGRGGHGAWQEGERGHVWHWACMAREAYMAGACITGGMCGRGGHMWQRRTCLAGGCA